jgi:hypothetical protein
VQKAAHELNKDVIVAVKQTTINKFKWAGKFDVACGHNSKLKRQQHVHGTTYV